MNVPRWHGFRMSNLHVEATASSGISWHAACCSLWIHHRMARMLVELDTQVSPN